MTNEQIKRLHERIRNGRQLTLDEQIDLLQQLSRANRRIQAAKVAGYPTEPSPGWLNSKLFRTQAGGSR